MLAQYVHSTDSPLEAANSPRRALPSSTPSKNALPSKKGQPFWVVLWSSSCPDCQGHSGRARRKVAPCLLVRFGRDEAATRRTKAAQSGALHVLPCEGRILLSKRARRRRWRTQASTVEVKLRHEPKAVIRSGLARHHDEALHQGEERGAKTMPPRTAAIRVPETRTLTHNRARTRAEQADRKDQKVGLRSTKQSAGRRSWPGRCSCPQRPRRCTGEGEGREASSICRRT